MIRHVSGLLAAMVLCGLLAGCGGVEQARARREVPGVTGSMSPVATAAEEATAAEADYKGWQAFRLTNGMATVVVVPELGGRIMEYKLGGHPFLWVNPAELERTPSTAGGKVAWRDFGGYRAWPTPAERWKAPPDPAAVALDGGKWTGKITVNKGRLAEVEVVSPEDQLTGLQITRTVQLYGGSSQVHITEKLTNKAAHAAEWGLRQVAQLPGVVETESKPTGKSQLFLPLNPESKFPDGYSIVGTGATSQYRVLADKLLQVSYLGQEGQLAADSRAGWLAHVDEAHGYAFVARFTVSQLGSYPEQGATVILRTAAAPSCLEVSLLSPLRTVQAGDSLEVSSDWFATRVGSPIVRCSDVAAVREPLKLTRKDDKLRLTGTLGVFAPGNLAIVLQDAAGAAIGQPILIKVSPADEVKVDKALAEETTAKKLVVELQNSKGTPLGQVAELEMGATVAKAETKPEPAK
jgi:hypothetical protein